MMLITTTSMTIILTILMTMSLTMLMIKTLMMVKKTILLWTMLMTMLMTKLMMFDTYHIFYVLYISHVTYFRCYIFYISYILYITYFTYNLFYIPYVFHIIPFSYTNCVPILTYACDIKQYSASEMSDCNVSINNAVRRIFGFKDWQSIRTLREIFHLKSIYKIFKIAHDRFIKSCQSNSNPIIRFIASVS